MARKSSNDALRDYLQADYDRWRLLARNSDFRKDVADYLNSWEPSYLRQCRKRIYSPSRRLLNKWDRLFKQYLAKWRINRLPDYEILHELKLAEQGSEWGIDHDLLERWYQADKKSEAERGNDEYTTGIFHPAYMTRIRPGPRAEQRYVEFLLDISIPVDQLTALLEKEVRRWIWKTYGEHARGKRQNLKFHLDVFDLMHAPRNGKKLTFADVASKLSRKPSTIRDAYFSACKRLGLTDHNSKPVPIAECPDTKCRNAQSLDDLCKAHKIYISQ